MNPFLHVYNALLKEHGPQGWWPIRSLTGTKGFDERGYAKGRYDHPSTQQHQFEVCVGAILTQNTAWRNVEKALDNLLTARVVTVERLASVRLEKLAGLIRPAGYFNQKARKLQLFACHVRQRGLRDMFQQPVPRLRDELLSLWGIGPETADSILLYAAHKPVFVIDAYTRRIFSGLGMCKESCSYDDLQQLFMNNLPPDVALFKEYHALIVESGKFVTFK